MSRRTDITEDKGPLSKPPRPLILDPMTPAAFMPKKTTTPAKSEKPSEVSAKPEASGVSTKPDTSEVSNKDANTKSLPSTQGDVESVKDDQAVPTDVVQPGKVVELITSQPVTVENKIAKGEDQDSGCPAAGKESPSVVKSIPADSAGDTKMASVSTPQVVPAGQGDQVAVETAKEVTSPLKVESPLKHGAGKTVAEMIAKASESATTSASTSPVPGANTTGKDAADIDNTMAAAAEPAAVGTVETGKDEGSVDGSTEALTNEQKGNIYLGIYK